MNAVNKNVNDDRRERERERERGGGERERIEKEVYVKLHDYRHLIIQIRVRFASYVSTMLFVKSAITQKLLKDCSEF